MQDLIRHRFLRKNHLIDSPSNVALNDITYFVTQLFNCEFATISIIDSNRIWFKSICGLNVKEIPLEPGLCETAFKMDEPLIINDTLEDPAAKQNSLVYQAPNIRSYMAAPIAINGVSFGTLTALSTKTTSYTKSDGKRLEALAKIVISTLEEEILNMEKQAELNAQIMLFRQFLDASSDVITFIDDDFRFRYTNQAGKDMCRMVFGRSPEKGDYIFDYIKKEYQLEYQQLLGRVFLGEQIDIERELLEKYHRIYIAPVRNNLGSITGAMFLLHDIQDRADSSKALQDNVEFLKNLAWSQSHEIRRPLANILGLIDIIQKIPEKSERLEKVAKNLGIAGRELDEYLHKNAKSLEQKLAQ